MKIAIIGVGTTGVKVADKINIANCSKLFLDSEYEVLANVKSEGENVFLESKGLNGNPILPCHYQDTPEFSRKVAESYEEEIRQAIISAFFKQ